MLKWVMVEWKIDMYNIRMKQGALLLLILRLRLYHSRMGFDKPLEVDGICCWSGSSVKCM
jgi:hypothetical protein